MFQDAGPYLHFNFFLAPDLHLTTYVVLVLSVTQPPYRSLHMHNLLSYTISHIWNRLPSTAKSAASLSEFLSLTLGS